MPAAMPVAPAGDSAVAKRAAIWLALSVPFAGLPIGWAFMMIEDRRRQAIGRLCVNWSLLGLVLHLFLGYFGMKVLIRSTLPVLAAVFSAIQNTSSPNSQSGLPRSYDTGQ